MIDSLYKFLASLKFTDPIHAPIVHIPIGLVIGAFCFFALAIIFKRKQFILTARQISIMAFVFAFPSILLGVFDWIHFYHGALLQPIKIKMVLAGVLLVLLGLGIILGGEAKPRRALFAVIYTLSFITVVGLGYFGGSMVFGGGSAFAQGVATIGVAEAPKTAGASAALPGKAIFEASCQACHAGGGNAIVASLPVKGSKKIASLEAFERFVRKPAMPDGKEGEMPAFASDALTDAQVKDLFAYVSAAFK